MATQIVATAFGGPEVLSPVEVEVPQPGPGQVVIAVKAAGINPVDHKIVSGMMGADPDRLPLPVGLEVAGVVTAVGPDATGPGGPIAVGDEVVAHPSTVGTPSTSSPPRTGRTEAARARLDGRGVHPRVGSTAAHALQVVAVKPGETLLVHGAAGSVGQIAVQLAVQEGSG